MKKAMSSEQSVIWAIAGNVRRLRIERGLKQTALASETDVTARLINEIENGKAYPSLRTLIKISDFFGKHPSQLMEVKP